MDLLKPWYYFKLEKNIPLNGFQPFFPLYIWSFKKIRTQSNIILEITYVVYFYFISAVYWKKKNLN